MLFQLIRIAEAGQHEELRRVNCPRRQNHFAGRADTLGVLTNDDFYATRTVSVEYDARDVCIQEER